MARRDPFDAARRKGAEAFAAGRSEFDCPYRDTRKQDGRLTFSRAWRHAWVEGFRAAKTRAMENSLLGD